MKSGEPVLDAVQGPPAPEVLISNNPNNGAQVILSGNTARWLLGLLDDVESCGRSEDTDTLCGDFMTRVADVVHCDVSVDEHSATRADRSEAA